MNSISEAFNKRKQENSKVFIPYVTAGDPSLAISKQIVKCLADCGSDIIELGVPFSDPIADGPTNQLASERALKHNVSLTDVLNFVKELRDEGVTTPLVLFTYLNPVFKMGYEKFASLAKASGVNGALVLDLPPEESDEYLAHMQKQGLDTIFLASPTTSKERLQKISDSTSGFLYYVSRVGVTGAKSDISSTLKEEILELKKTIKTPVAVGFGVSTPEQAKKISEDAEGVVVGSSIVKIIEQNQNNPDKLLENLSGYVKSLREATL